MKENPSHFSSGEDAVAINIDGQSIQMKPDHPVESMTWLSALVFANKLCDGEKFQYIDLTRLFQIVRNN